MCKVSDQLKLCTCKTKNVEKLKHYWILKRPNGEDNFIFGQAILPANIGKETDKLNSKILGKMLNNGNCFDVELQLQEHDILELHFTVDTSPIEHLQLPCHGNYLAYAYVFQNNKWKKTDYDPFGQNLDDIQKGKIDRPFQAV